MCSSGAKRQTEQSEGRANSELRNVAPQGEAAAEAPKKQKKPATFQQMESGGF